MSAHTPGPWHPWKGNYRHIYADENNSELVGIVSARSTFEEMRANARLVAAAPELLAALKNAVAEYDITAIVTNILEMRAAIAKAEAMK